MKKSLIAIVALAFAAVSFAAQTPAKPAASNAGQDTTNSTAKVKKSSHHKKPTQSATKSAGASNGASKQ